VFGLAAGGLLVLGLGQLTLGRDAGAGQYLSAGIVAAPVAVAYAMSLRRKLMSASESQRPA
jgi:hypothetical protein